MRYLVADTGKWLSGRKVLIAPEFLGDPDWPAKRFPVRLTREQVERSPELKEDEPVSVRREAEIAAYYGVAASMLPTLAPAAVAWGLAAPVAGVASTDGDPALRSLAEIEGYHVHATDGPIGHVEDLIADDRDWSIRYFIVDTRNWLPGKKVLVSPNWLNRFDWTEQAAEVDLTRSQVEHSPEFDSARPIHRAYEVELHRAFGKPRDEA